MLCQGGVFQFGTLQCLILFQEGQTTETQLFLMQFDIRVEVATMYKKEGVVHNSKQEQLVATAVVASQQIADADVTLPSVNNQSAYVTS